MKLLVFVQLLFMFMLSYAQTGGEPVTVKYVDLKKYAGLWYEISKIPNSFQKSCYKSTTAEYKIQDGGKIQVINSCIKEDGERKSTEGVAKVVDFKTNAKLEVSFFSILGIRPFWGDYWILGLGQNYEYAVIGTPSRNYGWILARKSKLEDDKLKEAYSILKQQGYDISKFEISKQD